MGVGEGIGGGVAVGRRVGVAVGIEGGVAVGRRVGVSVETGTDVDCGGWVGDEVGGRVGVGDGSNMRATGASKMRSNVPRIGGTTAAAR